MYESRSSPQELTQFVAAVSVAETETLAARTSVERAAEALDADVAAIVCGGELVAAVGYAEGSAPVDELQRVRPGAAGCRLEVPGLGVWPAAAATLEHPPGATLVVARPEPLTPAETALLRGMARVASMTMRLLRVIDAERAAREELERLAREQAALGRVATLVAKAGPPDAVFSAVAEEVARVYDADIATVLRYEADGSATVVGGSSNVATQLEPGTRLAVTGEGVAMSVSRTGRPTGAVRFAGPPGSVAHALRQAGAEVGSGSPIAVEGRVWGVVIAARTRPEPLSPEAERRIPAFTELVATAIANAQARVELRGVAEDQAALRRVATLVARGEPSSALFAAVAEEVGRVVAAADTSIVGRYDDGTIEVVGGWRRDGEPGFLGGRIRLGGRNVVTRVFERNAPARLTNLEDDGSEMAAFARDWRTRCAAAAPISVEGRLWGVVSAGSAHPEGLPAGTEHRVAEFTELVATSIANAQAREELRTVADEQAALRRVATLVAEAARPPSVFAAVAEEVGLLFRADLTFVGRYDGDDAVTIVAGWSAEGDAVAVGSTGRIGGRNLGTLVRETGRPARIDWSAGGGDDAPTGLRSLGIRSAVGAPITVEGRLWGLISVASTSDEPVPAGTEERLASFTGLVATTIANAQAQAELTASRARIVATADETRRKIERDLHDGAQQRLVSLALQLRAAQSAVPPDLAELAAELDDVAAGLTTTLDELREYARGIHPAILSEHGLAPALKMLARRSTVPVRLEVGTTSRLPEPLEVAAYFIASEALANAAKHANASSVEVRVEETEGALRLSVEDDGIGGADFAHGSGLVGLKDRVEALGGRFDVDSPPGGGTTVRAELPILGEHPLGRR